MGEEEGGAGVLVGEEGEEAVEEDGGDVGEGCGGCEVREEVG